MFVVGMVLVQVIIIVNVKMDILVNNVNNSYASKKHNPVIYHLVVVMVNVLQQINANAKKDMKEKNVNIRFALVKGKIVIGTYVVV